jgi:hypothetical protein
MVLFLQTDFIEKGNGTGKGDAKNMFVVDIQSIRVLVDPPQQVMSPKKRKTARRDLVEVLL